MKKYLIALGLLAGLLLGGCNGGSNSSGSPVSGTQQITLDKTESYTQSANKVAAGDLGYPLGNVIKYQDENVTMVPDKESGLLGVYIQNLMETANKESAEGKGALQLLVPDSEKAYFNTRGIQNYTMPGNSYPALGNPLASEEIKANMLDFQPFAWQLALNGVDSLPHSVFFKINDITSGKDIYFKLLVSTQQASETELTSKFQAITNLISGSKGLNEVIIKDLWWKLMICAAILLVMVGTITYMVKGWMNFGKATGGATAFGRLKGLSRLQSQGGKEVKYIFSDYVSSSGSGRVEETFLETGECAEVNSGQAFERVIGRGALVGIDGNILYVNIWKYLKVVIMAYGPLVLELSGLGFMTWYTVDPYISQINAKYSLSQNSSANYVYRDLKLEAVTAADVIKYPELHLQASKMAVDMGHSVVEQTAWFNPLDDNSGSSQYVIKLSSLDTTFMPKPVTAPVDGKTDYLKEDAYLGNRQPTLGVVNHFLDAAVLLSVQSVASSSALNEIRHEQLLEAAQTKGVVVNDFINSSPDVSVAAISNSHGLTANSLSANAEILEHGLAYTARNGVTGYKAISLQPGDKLKLTISNPVLNTAMGNQNATETSYANLDVSLLNADINGAFKSARTAGALGDIRPVGVYMDNCQALAPGKSCNVTVDVTQLGEPESGFTGVIFVADRSSKLTAVPITYGISKVLSPSIIQNLPGRGTAEATFRNTGKGTFSQLSLDRGDLDSGADAKMECYTQSGTRLGDAKPDLPAGGYCTIKLSGLDDIDGGAYHMQIMSRDLIFQSVDVQVY